MATEEKQFPKRRMSKEEKQTHQEDVQEKEDLQEEAGEQQKRERLMRKLRRSKSIDLRLLLPPLGLDRTWRPTPPHPLPGSSVCRVSCDNGPQEKWKDLPTRFERDLLKNSRVNLTKKSAEVCP